MTTARLSEIETLIEPIAQALGYSLVRVRISASRHPVVQVMAERADGGMDMEDCTRLHHALSAAFEEAEPFEGDFGIEVSSPGIDRPLTRRRDYESYAGHEARIDLRAPMDGRKRIKGVLKGLRGEDVLIEARAAADAQPVELALPFSAIAEAKLVLTDKLIAEDLKRRKAAEKAAPKRSNTHGH